MSKYAGIESGIYYKEYQESFDRYKELVSDYSFQQKLQELSHLEMIIAQVHCMQNIDARYTTAQTTPKTMSVYARMPYPRLRADVHVMTTSIGTISDFGDNHRKIAEHPLAIAESHNRLLSRMRKEFVYPIYKARFQ